MMIAAIVLAAGKSQRMGQNKLLMRLNDDTLLESILNSVTTAGVRKTIVVLGHKPDEIVSILKNWQRKVTIVINENYEQGMASSFQKGLEQALSAEAAFLILGDQPILDQSYLDIMIRKMESNLGKTLIVSPIHKGKRGHPILFHRQLFDEIMNLKKTETIRDVVHRHVGELLTVEAPEWTIMDVDTPEDIERVRRLIKTGIHPLRES
jgi:molybdenum cofactor cytidylyltransferase